MPLLVPTDELQVGMRVAEPVVAGGRVMLQAGKALTETDIDVLRRRFPTLSVRIGDPVLDSVIEFEDDARERNIATQTQKRVAQCLSGVHDRFARRASLQNVNVSGLQGAVIELMEYLEENPVSAALVNKCMDSSSYFGMHTGNVFYLSMLLAFKALPHVVAERKRQTGARDLGIHRAADLMSLGLAAMVMDLGMLPLQNLLNTRKPLTAEEAKAIREHPIAGADALPETFSPVARVAVRTHHENCCGTGYPMQLPQDKIHVFARILRIADAYDAATSEHIYQQAKSPARALWEMTVGPYKQYYDPELIPAFANLVQPFPIGSKLRLRDGRYAVVVRYNRQNPFDPKVMIAFDAQDQPLPQEQLRKPIHLGAHPEMRIASLAGEDLSFMYAGDFMAAMTERHGFTTALEAAYP